MMKKVLWILISFLTPCCAVALYALQARAPEFEHEFTAGKQAVEQNQFADAAGHFSKANHLRLSRLQRRGVL